MEVQERSPVTAFARLRAALPRGRTLPAPLWARRHRWMLTLLWAHVVLIPTVAFAYGGYSLLHSALEAVPIVAFAGVASLNMSRRVASCVVAAGLLTCSALLVHVTGGLIEAHFHFFVVMSILTLYEDWAPYAIAFAYVGLHHGLLGTLAPDHVYAHGGSAWVWSIVHAGFIGAAGVANVVSWRLNEAVRAHAAAEGRSRQVAEAAARTLGESLIPEPLPTLADARVAARYSTGDGEVGGDWFEVLDLPDGRIGVGLGDVAGRGVRAAVLTAKLRHTLRAHAGEGMAPGEILERLDRLADGSFATVAYAIVCPETDTVRISSAGHPPPLVVAPDGAARYPERAQGPPVAGFGGSFPETEFAFPAGSTLVLYSDGLFERRGEDLEVGLERLRAEADGVEGGPEALCSRLLFGVPEDGCDDDTALVAVQTVAASADAVVTVPAAPEHLTALRRAATKWAAAVGVDAATVGGLAVAVGEAAANAVEHSGTDVVEMHLATAGDSARIVIRDFGIWYGDAPSLGPADLDDGRGRGLVLMSGFCEVDVERRPDGTDVELRAPRGGVRGAGGHRAADAGPAVEHESLPAAS